MRILLEDTATRQVAAAARTDDGIRRAFSDLRYRFVEVAPAESTPVDGEGFYELTESYGQAIITHAANQCLSRTIAEPRPHNARLRIIAHSPKPLEPSRSEHLDLPGSSRPSPMPPPPASSICVTPKRPFWVTGCDRAVG